MKGVQKAFSLEVPLKLTKFHPYILFYKFIECQILPSAFTFISIVFHLEMDTAFLLPLTN